MQINSKRWYDYLSVYLYFGFMIFLSASLTISAVSDKHPYLQNEVYKVAGTTDTLQTFSDAVVTTGNKLQITQFSPAMKFWAPRPAADPLYFILFFLTSVLLTVFYHDFSYKNPFTRKALAGLYIGIILLIAFIIINFWRYEWFAKQVIQLTDGQFRYRKPGIFGLPEFWVLMILWRLIRLFQKGLGLQSETDLTV